MSSSSLQRRHFLSPLSELREILQRFPRKKRRRISGDHSWLMDRATQNTSSTVKGGSKLTPLSNIILCIFHRIFHSKNIFKPSINRWLGWNWINYYCTDQFASPASAHNGIPVFVVSRRATQSRTARSSSSPKSRASSKLFLEDLKQLTSLEWANWHVPELFLASNYPTLKQTVLNNALHSPPLSKRCESPLLSDPLTSSMTCMFGFWTKVKRM